MFSLRSLSLLVAGLFSTVAIADEAAVRKLLDGKTGKIERLVKIPGTSIWEVSADGQVLHEWCLAGHGIAWRSTWEVEAEIAEGKLQIVLDDFAAPPNGIYAVFPQRKHLPLRVRLWIDFLKHHYGLASYWKKSS